MTERDNDDDDDMLLVNDSFVATAMSTTKGSQGPAKQKALGKKKVAFPKETWSDWDDEDVIAAVENSVGETLNSEISTGAEVDQYDETSQWPSCLDDWEDWLRLPFESGNSCVFLKLAGWMLLRYWQLAHIDLDADVDGLIVPDNPRLRENLAQDQFYEALGMECLYSAIVHMDTRPQYLIHLFHALGKTIAESDIGQSHPTVWPIIPPPVVDAHNIEDMDIPWMDLQEQAHDQATSHIEEDEDANAIGSPDLDVGALSLMDDLRPTMHVDTGAGSMAKRHPPPQEGGRGPSKHQKDGDEVVPRLQSPSPIQSASGFNDQLVQATQLALVPTQIILTGDAMDDSMESMEPWDALASPTPSLIGDDGAHCLPVPSDAR
ncbi:hypothetical protein EDD22DRAFT_955670 [Suillus occidentalis]|nr:hypothetical protein EDD22DRAFT_955670 [Suillus occidentalis]